MTKSLKKMLTKQGNKRNSERSRPIALAMTVFCIMLLASTIAIANAEIYSFVTKWGSTGSGDGQFNQLGGVAVDDSGKVYVVDSRNFRVEKFSSSGDYLTQWSTRGHWDEGYLNPWPLGIAVDGSGNVYVGYISSVIVKFSGSGEYLTDWGSLGSGDGQFNQPSGIAVDASGYVYVTDNINNRVQKFTSTGSFVSQWGTPGSGNGQFIQPSGVAVDDSGNVYVVDGSSRIQKFTSTGEYLTQWGILGSGTQYNLPYAVCVDNSGNVYVIVGDYFDRCVQKFSNTGVFLAKLGSGGVGDDQFMQPSGVAVDNSGNVYVTDSYNAVNELGYACVKKFALNSQSVNTDLSIGASPSSVMVGLVGPHQYFTVSGDLTSGGVGLSRYLEGYYKVDSGSWISMGSLWSDSAGHFVTNFAPQDYGIGAGSTVYFKAIWVGDDSYDVALAESTGVTTVPRPELASVSLSIGASPSSVMVGLVGPHQYFTVSGDLTSGGVGLSRYLEINYKVDSGSWNSFTALYSDGGSFVTYFAPQDYGVGAGSTVYFKAIWVGDDSYAAAFAESTGVTTVPRPELASVSLSIGASPSSVMVGLVGPHQYFTVSGDLTSGGVGLSRYLEINYKVDSGSWNSFTALYSDGGSFVTYFAPQDYGVGAGSTVYFKAIWVGDDSYAAAFAESTGVTTVPRPELASVSLSIGASPSSVMVGLVGPHQYFTVSGDLTSGGVGLSRYLEINYKVDSGSWNSFTALYSDGGSFVTYFAPQDYGVGAGSTVYFKAIWVGDDSYAAAFAESTGVTTVPRPELASVSLSIGASPSSVMVGLVGPHQYFTVSGDLTSGGVGLSRYLEGYYKVDSGSWISMGSLWSDSAGHFVTYFAPQDYGVGAGSTVYFKAIWSGDDSYAAAFAESTGVTTVPRPELASVSLSIGASPSSVMVGLVGPHQYFTVSGDLTSGGVGLSRYLEINYKVDSGSWNSFTALYSDGGSFVTYFAPQDYGVGAGSTVYFKAIWVGDDSYAAAFAESTGVTTVPRPELASVSLSIGASPSSVMVGLVGPHQYFTVSGDLTSGGVGLSRYLEGYYKVDSGSWISMGSLWSDSAGHFVTYFAPQDYGVGAGSTVYFKAIWSGDDSYAAAFAESTGVTTTLCSLTLNAGWNMVSFPVVPADSSFASIFSGKGYYQVLTWTGTSYTTPSNVEPGKGYWILVLSPTTINMEGTPVISYSSDLSAGWNMIGSVNAQTVDCSSVFSDYYQVLTWSGTSYTTATTIEQGKGYWALVLVPTHITVG